MKLYVDGTALLDYLAERKDPLVVQGRPLKSKGNLTRWVARYCEFRDCDAVVVYESDRPDEILSPTEHFSRTTVVNVPYGEEVRAEIAGPANRTALGERVFVVTDDFHLAAALERGRATTYSCEQFVRRARRLMHKSDEPVPNEPDEKFTGLTNTEVDFWLKYFEGED